ncbi:hypothetical protein BKA61DRAFT_567218 [Leptodontidium sp. MPI-SDFR-AT-0119]|nr:hypothetical protein BKA61DRAFT_567218 [Leptodontidium sp. MPI-SDFR-AT-0119]
MPACGSIGGMVGCWACMLMPPGREGGRGEAGCLLERPGADIANMARSRLSAQNGWTSEERSSAGQFRQRSNRSRRVGEHPISDLDRHKKQESRLEGLAATIALRLFAAVDWRAEPTWAVRSRICRRTEPSKWSSLGFAPHRDRGLKENTGRSAAKTS